MPSQADLALQSLGGASAPAVTKPQTQADIALAAASGASDSGAPTSSGLSQYWDAASHHVMKLVDGVGQLGEHAITGALNLLPDNPVSRAMNRQNAADDLQSTQWEQAYQKRVPDSTASYLGAATGEVAPFLVELPAKGLKLIGDGAELLASKYLPAKVAPVAGKVAGAAAQGAAVGATQPVTNPTSLSDLITTDQPGQNDYWTQKAEQVGFGGLTGGALGAGGAAAAPVFRKVGDVGSSLLNPSGYAARNIGAELGPDTQRVIKALKNPTQYVPGSVPTAAQEAGGTKLVMLEKALSNANPEFRAKLTDLENSNNAARIKAVSDVAKTPEELQAAIELRNAQTAPMRDFTVTNGNPVPVDGVNGAISSVADGPLGVRPTIGSAANAMRNEVQGFTTTTPPNTLTNTPGSSTASPAMLDALRQNSNDYLSKFAPNGAVGTQEQAAMMPVKSAIIDAIDAANPGHKLGQGGWGQGLPQQGPEAPSYRDYLRTFAQKSVPINTMEVGQNLLETLRGKTLNTERDPGVTFSSYKTALAKALRGSDYAIDPQAQAALEAVQADLQRSTVSQGIRSPGSDTAYNNSAGAAFLKSLGAKEGDSSLSIGAGGAALAATASPAAAFAAAVAAKKANGFLANRVGSAMGDLFLDPQRLATELQAQSTPSAIPALTARLNNKALAAALLLQLQNKQRAEEVQR